MTELWTRVPQWLSLDAGVRGLPAPARVALYDLAVGGGHASCGADPVAALDGLCADAGSSLPRMLDLGVVQVANGRIYLMAPDGLPSAVGATETARAGAQAARSGEAPSLADGSPLRLAQRRLGALWSKAKLDTAAARRAWFDTDAGARALSRLAEQGIARDEALSLADRTTESRRQLLVNSSSTGRQLSSTPSSTRLPSQTLPSEKEQEKKREESARGSSTRVVNPVRVDDGVDETSSTVNSSTVETIGAKFHPDEVLGAMGAASGHLVSTAGIASEKVAFTTRVRELLASGATLDVVVASAVHLTHGHWTQRQKRTALSAARLVAPGHNGKPSILTELLVESETCAECRRARAPRVEAAPEAPTAPIKYVTGDEARAIRAAARANAEAKRKETANVRV